MDMNLSDQLKDYLASYNIEVNDLQANLLLKHLQLLIKKNNEINLTRISSIEDGLIKHIVDSSLIVDVLNSLSYSENQSYLDIGTGAGFPGIPLAILTRMNGILIDSVGKKVIAVNHFIQELAISNVNAQQIRAEELAQKSPQNFDFVFARAVAELNVLLEYASPLLKSDGYFVASKAHVQDSEMQNAIRVGKICGFTFVSSKNYELPQNLGFRSILVFKKTHKSSIQLPRPIGYAKHKQL